MCRPVKFEFAKEIGTKIFEKVGEVANKIEILLPSSLTMNDSSVRRTVSHMDFRLLSFDTSSKNT